MTARTFPNHRLALLAAVLPALALAGCGSGTAPQPVPTEDTAAVQAEQARAEAKAKREEALARFYGGDEPAADEDKKKDKEAEDHTRPVGDDRPDPVMAAPAASAPIPAPYGGSPPPPPFAEPAPPHPVPVPQ